MGASRRKVSELENACTVYAMKANAAEVDAANKAGIPRPMSAIKNR